MDRFAHLTKSQLQRRAKWFTAIWMSWLFVGEFVAAAVPGSIEVPVMLCAMVPFVVAGQYGIPLWYRAKSAPEVPHARVAKRCSVACDHRMCTT